MSSIYVIATRGRPDDHILPEEVEVVLDSTTTEDDVLQALYDAEQLAPSPGDGREEWDDPWTSEAEWKIVDSEGAIAEALWDKGTDVYDFYKSQGLHEMAEDCCGADDDSAEQAAVYFYLNFNSTSLQDFRSAFNGFHESEEDFAVEIADELFDIPDSLEPFFDYERLAHHLFNTDYCRDDLSGAVFRNY